MKSWTCLHHSALLPPLPSSYSEKKSTCRLKKSIFYHHYENEASVEPFTGQIQLQTRCISFLIIQNTGSSMCISVIIIPFIVDSVSHNALWKVVFRWWAVNKHLLTVFIRLNRRHLCLRRPVRLHLLPSVDIKGSFRDKRKQIHNYTLMKNTIMNVIPENQNPQT